VIRSYKGKRGLEGMRERAKKAVGSEVERRKRRRERWWS
jgi:hypothetical protein